MVTEFIAARLHEVNPFHTLMFYPLSSILILFSYVTLNLESCLFPAGFPTKISFNFLSHLNGYYRCRLI